MPDGTNQQIWILRRDTLEVVSAFGRAGHWAGQFYGAHNIAADASGNIYISETYEGKRVQKFVYRGWAATIPQVPQDIRRLRDYADSLGSCRAASLRPNLGA